VQSWLSALQKRMPAGLRRACHGFARPARLPSAASSADGGAAAAQLLHFVRHLPVTGRFI